MELEELNLDRLPQGRGSRAAGQELLRQFIACSAIFDGGQMAFFARLDLTPPTPYPDLNNSI